MIYEDGERSIDVTSDNAKGGSGDETRDVANKGAVAGARGGGGGGGGGDASEALVAAAASSRTSGGLHVELPICYLVTKHLHRAAFQLLFDLVAAERLSRFSAAAPCPPAPVAAVAAVAAASAASASAASAAIVAFFVVVASFLERALARRAPSAKSRSRRRRQRSRGNGEGPPSSSATLTTATPYAGGAAADQTRLHATSVWESHRRLVERW